MLVFLVHGMGRTPFSLSLLARRLTAHGHEVSRFGYRVQRESLDGIASRFSAHVREALARPREDARYAVVGHSLGNVVTRLASPELPPGLHRFVMLAPPNRSPVMARKLANNFIFRALTRDAGARLATPAFFDTLPVPAVPMLIFAGTSGPRARFLPFSGQPSDGIVAVHETRLDHDQAMHREVPCLHTFIMNDAHVTHEILAFLQPSP